MDYRYILQYIREITDNNNKSIRTMTDHEVEEEVEQYAKRFMGDMYALVDYLRDIFEIDDYNWYMTTTPIQNV